MKVYFLYYVVGFLGFSLLPYVAVAQSNYQNISLGWSLVASDDSLPLLSSPSGDFALGFLRLNNQNLYLLSIWFNKIPSKTVVWYANGDNPVPQESRVELTSDGHLSLADPDGAEIWSPKSGTRGLVAYGAFLDTGNLILISHNSTPVWQSFEEPSDTLLPTQILKMNTSLSARTAEDNFLRGRFELRLIPDGNVVMNTVGLPNGNAYDAYFWSNTVNAIGAGDSITRNLLIFNESGYLYIDKGNGEIKYITSPDVIRTSDLYYRATMDYDGVLRLYTHPKSPPRNGTPASWSTFWYGPRDICSAIHGQIGGGTCGFNSFCILEENGRPRCECIPGFKYPDPSNKLSGCEQDSIQICDLGAYRPEDVYAMDQLDDIFWPNSSNYEQLELFSDDQCRNSCLNDCNCVVAEFSGGTCLKKKLPVSNGRRIQTVNGKAFIKMLISNIPSANFPEPRLSNTREEKDAFSLLASLLLGSSAFLNLLLVLVIVFIVLRSSPGNGRRKDHHKSDLLGANLRSFTYQDLKEATNKFKEELGRGSFGIVYKGYLQLMFDTETPLAIKKLDKLVGEGEKEFRTEATVIAKTHHKNLVRLFGFCDEGLNKLLVYEFMSNGSLASVLFGNSRPEWSKRTQWALEIARGLMYLHEECSTQIIHCDIKPQNILLDDSLTAKISDFGLAKLLMSDQTRTLTAIRGTKGYVAPEWFRGKPITTKVDVYSYGVMLLEIIFCRKCVDVGSPNEEEVILSEWVHNCYKRGKLHELVKNDAEPRDDMRQLEKFVIVAIWCIQEDTNLRPSMKTVLHMLEGVIQVSPPPSPSPHTSVSGNSVTFL